MFEAEYQCRIAHCCPLYGLGSLALEFALILLFPISKARRSFYKPVRFLVMQSYGMAFQQDESRHRLAQLDYKCSMLRVKSGRTDITVRRHFRLSAVIRKRRI